MRFAWGALLLLAIIAVVSPVSFGADVAKIGLVDYQRILEQSDAGKAAREAIDRQGKKMETSLETIGAELETMRKELDNTAVVLNSERREEKERALNDRVAEFKELQQRYIADFRAEEMRLIERFRADIDRMVGEVGRKEGYLLIVEKREAGVIYGPESIDLTDRLIRMYNAEHAGRNAQRP